MITALQHQHLPSVLDALASISGVTQRDADSVASLQRYLHRNPDLSVIAHRGEALAGFVLSGHDGRRGYLNHLVVMPEFRRQGLATLLVESALERLSRESIAKVHVDVLVDNATAQAFWAKIGWRLRNDIFRFSIVTAGGANA